VKRFAPHKDIVGDRRFVAPYFVEADVPPDVTTRPPGGPMVVTFGNVHLRYALTWFTLGLGLGVIAVVGTLAARHGLLRTTSSLRPPATRVASLRPTLPFQCERTK
jgi:cytochrome oxidase assembly protein ShyY1